MLNTPRVVVSCKYLITQCILGQFHLNSAIVTEFSDSEAAQSQDACPSNFWVNGHMYFKGSFT